MATPQDFHTTDTALASFLVISGIPLVDLDISEHPARFVFDGPNGKLSSLINEWESGDTICVAFYRQYRKFVDSIKRNESGRR